MPYRNSFYSRKCLQHILPVNLPHLRVLACSIASHFSGYFHLNGEIFDANADTQAQSKPIKFSADFRVCALPLATLCHLSTVSIYFGSIYPLGGGALPLGCLVKVRVHVCVQLNYLDCVCVCVCVSLYCVQSFVCTERIAMYDI